MLTFRHRAKHLRGRMPMRVLVAAISISVAAAGCGGDSQGAPVVDGAADKLASVKLTPVADAEPIALGQATPLPLVVNLWATWCPPCRKELPDFEKVAQDRADSVRFVGINVGEDEASATKFLNSVGVTFDQYLDENSELQLALDVTGMPSTAFFAADGTLTEVVSGALTRTQLEEKVDALTKAE